MIRLTEAEIWYDIFIEYTSPDYTLWYDISHYGICSALYIYKDNNSISITLYDIMLKKVQDCLVKGGFGLFCTYNDPNRKLRADWCYLQYLSCLTTKQIEKDLL